MPKQARQTDLLDGFFGGHSIKISMTQMESACAKQAICSSCPCSRSTLLGMYYF